jgi:cytochrome c
MKSLMIAAALAIASSATLAAPFDDAIAKAGCTACHTKDNKILGPAFKDVAAKYKGQDATAKLVDKVRKGGSGVYGPIPMPPNGADKISDADLKMVVESVLKL